MGCYLQKLYSHFFNVVKEGQNITLTSATSSLLMPPFLSSRDGLLLSFFEKLMDRKDHFFFTFSFFSFFLLSSSFSFSPVIVVSASEAWAALSISPSAICSDPFWTTSSCKRSTLHHFHFLLTIMRVSAVLFVREFKDLPDITCKSSEGSSLINYFAWQTSDASLSHQLITSEIISPEGIPPVTSCSNKDSWLKKHHLTVVDNHLATIPPSPF